MLSVARALELHHVTGLVRADDALQRAHAVDRLAVRLDDQVTKLEAGLLRRATLRRRERADLGTRNFLEFVHGGILCRHLTELHTDDPAANFAVRDDVVHHGARECDRNREAVAGVIARLARNRAVDADHFSADVHQRSARVPRIDRCVRLDEILNRVQALAKAVQPLPASPLGADDTSRDGEVESERIADRHGPFADAGLGVVTEHHGRQV